MQEILYSRHFVRREMWNNKQMKMKYSLLRISKDDNENLSLGIEVKFKLILL